MNPNHISINPRQKIYVAIIFCLMISGLSCKVTKPYAAADVTASASFRDMDSSDTTNIAKLHWKELFTDTLLQKLITEGIANNLDLQTAYSRTRQAQAYFQQSKQAFLPDLNASVAATAATSSNPAALTSIHSYQYQSELTASWEADIWGKLKSAKRAEFASLLQADANAKAVQTSLVANIASNYYALMALDQQLMLTRQSVKNWQSTVDVMKELKKGDVVTGAAVVQSEASKYAVSVTIPDLIQSVRETENQLNLLLARVPGPIVRDSLNAQHATVLLRTGVPVQLLANRPDVRAAEYNFRYNFELTNVARTYFYPSLTLSATGGYGSYSSFFGIGSWIGNLTAGLAQPIFNKGANKTRLRVALEQQQQAALSFKTAVLTASQDVSNAMYAYQASVNKTEDRDNQLANLKKSVNYTQQLVRYGSANYTEVLTAQQSLLVAQLNKVNDRLQQLQATVYLYRALGGGWQ